MINPIWLAGFFDGEGSCSITIYPKKSKHGKFCPQVVLTQSEQKTINTIDLFEAIKRQFGLKGYIQTIKPREDQQSTVYALRLTSKDDILKFIELIYEYCIIKKRQLELLKEFFNIKNEKKYWRSKPLLRGLEIAYELGILNKRPEEKLKRLSEEIDEVKRISRELKRKVGTKPYPSGCKFCGSSEIVKDGLDPRGKQRFECRDCKRHFVWPISLEIRR